MGSASPRSRTFIAAATLALLCAAVFGRAVGYSFLTYWDDGTNIVGQGFVESPGWAALVSIWTKSHASLYIPATYTVWMTLAWFARSLSIDEPALFHLANVVVHWMNALLVFTILRDLARERQVERADLAAFAGAAIFACHPLQVEAVAWATGMKDLLAAFFTLLALLSFRRERFEIMIGCFAVALLAKPSAVVFLPLAYLLRPKTSSLQSAPVQQSASACGILAIMATALTATLQTPASRMPAVPFWVRPFEALSNIAFYLRHVVLPYPQWALYDFGIGARMQDSALFVSAALTAAGLGALWWLFRRLALPFESTFGVFVAALLPVLGFVTFTYQWNTDVADRYAYLAMLGIAVLVSSLVQRFAHPLMLAVVAVLVLVLSVLSFLRLPAWTDNDSILADMNASNPEAYVTNFSLADDYAQKGEYELSLKHARAAYEKKADREGLKLLTYPIYKLGRFDDYIAALKSWVDSHPNENFWSVELGELWVLSGHAADGLALMRGALKRDPRLMLMPFFPVPEDYLAGHREHLADLETAHRQLPEVRSLTRLFDLSKRGR